MACIYFAKYKRRFIILEFTAIKRAIINDNFDSKIIGHQFCRFQCRFYKLASVIFKLFFTDDVDFLESSVKRPAAHKG